MYPGSLRNGADLSSFVGPPVFQLLLPLQQSGSLHSFMRLVSDTASDSRTPVGSKLVQPQAHRYFNSARQPPLLLAGTLAFCTVEPCSAVGPACSLNVSVGGLSRSASPISKCSCVFPSAVFTSRLPSMPSVLKDPSRFTPPSSAFTFLFALVIPTGRPPISSKHQ